MFTIELDCVSLYENEIRSSPQYLVYLSKKIGTIAIKGNYKGING